MSEQDPAAYRAGYLDGSASRQADIDRLEDFADRYYRFAFDDDRRPVIAAALIAIELEQRRELRDMPGSVTTTEALNSWGYPTSEVDVASQPAPAMTGGAGRTNRISRKRAMSHAPSLGTWPRIPKPSALDRSRS